MNTRNYYKYFIISLLLLLISFFGNVYFLADDSNDILLLEKENELFLIGNNLTYKIFFKNNQIPQLNESRDVKNTLSGSILTLSVNQLVINRLTSIQDKDKIDRAVSISEDT